MVQLDKKGVHPYQRLVVAGSRGYSLKSWAQLLAPKIINVLSHPNACHLENIAANIGKSGSNCWRKVDYSSCCGRHDGGASKKIEPPYDPECTPRSECTQRTLNHHTVGACRPEFITARARWLYLGVSLAGGG